MWQLIMRSPVIVQIPETLAAFIYICSFTATAPSCKRFTHSSLAFISEAAAACLLNNKKAFNRLHHIKNLHVTEEPLQSAR